MQTVELVKVRKAYGDQVAVDDLSLTIDAGRIYGLLGPNGAGKTSTIRMMIGITLPDSGEIRLFRERFRREHLQRIGYLPEERGLYRKMKVLDELIFMAELHGVSATAACAKAKQWCERLAIADSMQKKLEELSKGMQQKIQFIAALLHEPDFIIMDEPFSGLDPLNADLLKDVLLELKQKGKTILFSTHRMDQVEKLCDSICLIDKGRSVLEGDLRQIKSRYGRNSVEIEYEGAGDFLKQSELIQSFNNYGNWVEIRLVPGADTQRLLRLAAERSRVNRFQLVEPSLGEIFKEVVGKSDA